jgi:hypothetical protein
MPVRRVPVLLLIFASWAWSGQSEAATCAFDAAAAAVTVTVNGQLANLAAKRTTGEILLNGAPCAGATVLNTDSIQVSGGSTSDTVSLTGRFEPDGATDDAEPDPLDTFIGCEL